MVDENGRNLAGNIVGTVLHDPISGNQYTERTKVRIPSEPGQSIIEAKGELRLLVGAGHQRAVIQDVEKQTAPAKMLQAKVYARWLPGVDIVGVVVAANEGVGRNGGGNGVALLPLEIRVMDDQGREVGEGSVRDGINEILVPAGMKGPLQVEVEGPEAIEEAVVPVEIRGVKLP
jgi:hypothetical protein